MKTKKQLEAEGRGALDYAVDVNSNVVIVRWLDNGIVQLISTFVGPSIGNNITRWCGKEKKVIEVQCPEIVHQYNKHMGGVDLCDMLMSLYRIRLGTKKWYFHIVYYGIGVAVVNGWLLYKRHAQLDMTQRKNMLSLLDFQSRIADSLMRENKVVTVGRPKLSSPPKRAKKACASKVPASEIRYDNTGHLASFMEKTTEMQILLHANSML